MRLNSMQNIHTNHRRKRKQSPISLLSLLLLNLNSTAIGFKLPLISNSIPSKPPSQDNPDLIQPESLRLSHSGLYVNLPSSPLQPTTTSSTSTHSTSLLSLYLDTLQYDPQSVQLEISSIKQRNWEDITYHCGIGGIENCRNYDLKHSASSSSSSTSTLSSNSTCQPISDSIPGRLDFHLQDCLTRLDPFLHSTSSNFNSYITSQISTLTSTVLKVTVRPSVSNSDSKPEIHSFWLAHLVNPNDDQRALWPLQGSAHASLQLESESSRGVDQKQLELENRRKWLQLGKEPNRIAGLMENPYLPKAAVVKDDDPDRGIDMRAAFWKLGISIRVPVGDSSTSSIDSIFESLTQDESETLKARLQQEEKEELEALEKFRQTEEDRSSITKRTQKVFSNSDPSWTSSEYSSNKDSTPNLVTFSSLLPNNQSTFGYSPVLSPVGGQVVYVRPYEIPIAPISGPGKSLNNEKGLVIQIRDEFGFVYQIFGISPLRIAIKEGQVIEKGQFLGGISKRPLSDTPLSRRKPADLPKNVRDSPRKAKYYPFRFRELRLNVARPNPEWKEWKEPFAKGWQYYNPLNFLSRGSSPSGWRSNIPPYGNPNSIFFASPPKSKEEAISTNFVPNAFASSEDFLTPVLRGNVELITGFDSFFQTPGNEGDGLDGLAIHRMDWGLVRKLGNGEMREEEKSGNENDGLIMDRSCNVGEDEKVDWRLAFEHHKFPLEPISSHSSSSSESTHLSHPSNLLLRSYFLPAFSTGFFIKSYQTSQFDEKSRHLLYSPTRNIRGSPALGPEASWNTRDTKDGDYELLVRAGDWFGNKGCVRSKIKIRNL